MFEATLYIAVAYILLCKLNHGYHNQACFINIFQTKHFSAVKFAIDYEKKYKLSCDTKISKVRKKKLKKSDWVPLNVVGHFAKKLQISNFLH